MRKSRYTESQIMAKAINYTDNNEAGPIALGRKSWLFGGSNEDGRVVISTIFPK